MQSCFVSIMRMISMQNSNGDEDDNDEMLLSVKLFDSIIGLKITFKYVATF